MNESRWKRALQCLATVALALALSGRCVAQDIAPDGSGLDQGPAALESSDPAAEESEAPPVKRKLGPTGIPTVVKPAPKAKAPLPKGIYLSPVTPVDAGVNVHDKVLDSCKLQSLLPQSIAERNSEVVLSDGIGEMKLELRIVDIHAPNGGWFSGPKWITVEGRLLQGKTVKGSFIAKESSMASAKTCGMLTKVTVVLAADIAAWLENPEMDSRLGRAR